MSTRGARKGRILVVAAEPQLRRLLNAILKANGYQALFAGDVAEAIWTHAALSPQLLVLDLDLPTLNGRNAILETRRWSDVPIIALSGRRTEADLVAALDLGADDYVETPFRPAELLARIRSVLRRGLKAKDEVTVYHCGALKVDILEHVVRRAGAPVRLTPTEFEILSLLVRNVGRIVSHQRLLEFHAGQRSSRSRQALRSAIWGLRQKIEDNPHDPKLVVTEGGFGYRLVKSGEGAAARNAVG